MKTKARTFGVINTKPSPKNLKPKVPWWSKLNPKKIIDNLPIMSHSKDQRERIQLPIHSSSALIATMIREKYPEKFPIDLDVHKSMHYAGRQLFAWVFLENEDIVKASRRYQMAMAMDKVDSINYDANWIEAYLGKLMEGYLSRGSGQFSRENIIDKITEAKTMIPEEFHTRCDNFIDDDLDSPVIQHRIKERIRKRKYRRSMKQKEKLKLVV